MYTIQAITAFRQAAATITSVAKGILRYSALKNYFWGHSMLRNTAFIG